MRREKSSAASFAEVPADSEARTIEGQRTWSCALAFSRETPSRRRPETRRDMDWRSEPNNRKEADSMGMVASAETSIWGVEKSAGVTPTIEYGRPSTRISLPRMSGSAAKRSFQHSKLITATLEGLLGCESAGRR